MISRSAKPSFPVLDSSSKLPLALPELDCPPPPSPTGVIVVALDTILFSEGLVTSASTLSDGVPFLERNPAEGDEGEGGGINELLEEGKSESCAEVKMGDGG